MGPDLELSGYHRKKGLPDCIENSKLSLLIFDALSTKYSVMIEGAGRGRGSPKSLEKDY